MNKIQTLMALENKMLHRFVVGPEPWEYENFVMDRRVNNCGKSRKSIAKIRKQSFT